MEIEVFCNNDDEIFSGDADEFLELNDYDTELESVLNILNCMRIGRTVDFTSDLGQSYSIRKISNSTMIYQEVELCYMLLMVVIYQQNRF